MPKGRATNRNPSPATRFGAGVSGNPIGKTSEQRQAEIRNAWLATKIQEKMLEAVAAMIDSNPAAAIERIDPPTLKLVKDAQDRGLGTPQGAVDITTNGKDMRGGLDLSKLSDSALAEIVAAFDAANGED